MSRDEADPRYEEIVSALIPPDAGAIHVRVVVVPHGDPVEMTSDEVRDFAAKLLALAAQLDADASKA